MGKFTENLSTMPPLVAYLSALKNGAKLNENDESMCLLAAKILREAIKECAEREDDVGAEAKKALEMLAKWD